MDEAGAAGETTWYDDADGDGYGDDGTAVSACDAPAGTIATVQAPRCVSPWNSQAPFRVATISTRRVGDAFMKVLP